MKVIASQGFPRGGLPDDVELLGWDAPGEGVGFAVPTWGEDARRLGDLPDLRVVQVLSAGVDWVERNVPDGVTLCNAGRHALARAQMLRERAGLPLHHVVSGPARPSR